MSHDQPFERRLLSMACSLINCAQRELSGRIERMLDLVRSEGLADHVWLYTVGYGENPPPQSEKTWRSKGAPRLRSALKALIKRRCAGQSSDMPLRLNPLQGSDLATFPQELCSKAHLIVCGPCGALVVGWADQEGNEETIRRHLDGLSEVVCAVASRWQRERLQQRGRNPSSTQHLAITMPSSMSSALTAAVQSSPGNEPQPFANPLQQTELWRAYALFEVINRGSEDLITIHDTKGACLYANDACSAVLGLNPEELIGQTPYHLIHPEDHQALRQALEAMIDHGVSNTIECRLRDAGGHWRWMESRNGAVRDENGLFTEMVMMFRDITERRDYEQTLSFSEHNLKAILDNVPDAAWLKDCDGRFLVANPATERLFGAERDELIGRSEGEFIGLADAHRALEFDQMVMLKEEGVSYTHHLGRDGCDETILEVRKEPVINDDGQIIGICGYAQDVTRLVKIQLDLIRATLLMSHAEDAAQVGLWSLQAATDEWYWNQQMLTLCGFASNAQKPSLETFLQMIASDQRAAAATAFDDCRHLLRPFRMEVTITRCDNHKIAAILVGAPFQNGYGQVGEIAGVLVPRSL